MLIVDDVNHNPEINHEHSMKNDLMAVDKLNLLLPKECKGDHREKKVEKQDFDQGIQVKEVKKKH